jgi:predicted Zn finger-like uncharacterized protein
MFTVCSKCNLRLTVTATDLRAAQGYVRCGRCHNVFNALAALADDPARQPETATPTDTQSRLALKAPEPQSPEPPAEPEPEHAETDTSLEFNPASTNINEVFIEAGVEERTGTFESIILIGEDPTTEAPPTDPVVTPQAPLAPQPATPAAAAPEAATQTKPVAEPAGSTEVEAAPVATASADATPLAETPVVVESAAEVAETAPFVDPIAAREIASAMEPDAAPVPAALLAPEHAAPRVPRWAVHATATALALSLIAQVVHHYRGELADTSLLHGPLTGLYQTLGQPLEPRWNVADYEIRQLGASTDGAAAGDLVVRASISNRAPRVQPLPLLRVVMQDRFGNRVAGRDLEPAEYLGPGAPQVSLMASGQRVDVQVAFQDPGQTATGFEIDACMAGRDHNVTCANDPGAR